MGEVNACVHVQKGLCCILVELPCFVGCLYVESCGIIGCGFQSKRLWHGLPYKRQQFLYFYLYPSPK
jgi:hypothetical protein